MKTKVILNPDVNQRTKIITALNSNKLKYGKPYCPCSLTKNSGTVCQCQEFRDMIQRNEIDECHCGLYHIVETEED